MLYVYYFKVIQVYFLPAAVVAKSLPFSQRGREYFVWRRLRNVISIVNVDHVEKARVANL